jgi:hypothetical protein
VGADDLSGLAGRIFNDRLTEYLRPTFCARRGLIALDIDPAIVRWVFLVQCYLGAAVITAQHRETLGLADDASEAVRAVKLDREHRILLLLCRMPSGSVFDKNKKSDTPWFGL